MGDVIRYVSLRGVADGRLRKTVDQGRGLLDTGASQTVISPELATRLGAKIIPQGTQIEGKLVDEAVLDLRVAGDGGTCGRIRLTVVVDAYCCAKAPPDDDIIVGHDDMQKVRLGILLHPDPRPKMQFVFCDSDAADGNGPKSARAAIRRTRGVRRSVRSGYLTTVRHARPGQRCPRWQATAVACFVVHGATGWYEVNNEHPG
jgi:hypothetical protein